MGKYENINCPICNEPLENGMDIAICPDCGAPYHHKCISQTGECIYSDLHNAGEYWQPPQTKEQKYAGDEPKKCSRCGTVNPISGIFCEICGNPLNGVPNESQENAKPHQNPYPNMNMGGQNPNNMGQNNMGQNTQYTRTFHIPFDPVTMPFGGLNPEDTIDDIPVKEMAIFVGQNTPYFLPKFKKMSEKVKFQNFNLAAAFFHGFYFIYRKMYLIGALMLLAIVTLSIPSALININELTKNFDIGFQTNYSVETLTLANNICNIIRIALYLFSGFFANKLYKNHCVDRVNRIRAKELPHDEYMQQLSKKGSTSTKAIATLLIAYIAFSLIASSILLFFV